MSFTSDMSRYHSHVPSLVHTCDMTHSYATPAKGELQGWCVQRWCDMTHSRETCLMHMAYNSFTCNVNDIQLVAMHMTYNSFTCDVTHWHATPAKGELRGWCVQVRCRHALPTLHYCALPLLCGMLCRLAALCDMTLLIYAWYDSFECVTGTEVW